MGSPNENWLQRVRLTAAEASSWRLLALNLRLAAEDVWTAGNNRVRDKFPPRPDFALPETGGETCDVCFMLFGYALENLAKGIIICRNPAKVLRDRLLPWPDGGHNLETLFRDAKLAVSDSEKNTLRNVSRIVLWRARYPTPTNFAQTEPQDAVLYHTAVRTIWPVEEYKILNGLYERATSALLQVMKDIPALDPGHRFLAGKMAGANSGAGRASPAATRKANLSK